MPDTRIDTFARQLVRSVRDAAVRSCDARLDPDAEGPLVERWRSSLRDGSGGDLIPDVVDTTLAALLRAIDDGGLRLRFVSVDGEEVDLTEEGLGELAGWYLGSADSWRAKYSCERVTDFLTGESVDP